MHLAKNEGLISKERREVNVVGHKQELCSLVPYISMDLELKLFVHSMEKITKN